MAVMSKWLEVVEAMTIGSSWDVHGGWCWCLHLWAITPILSKIYPITPGLPEQGRWEYVIYLLEVPYMILGIASMTKNSTNTCFPCCKVAWYVFGHPALVINWDFLHGLSDWLPVNCSPNTLCESPPLDPVICSPLTINMVMYLISKWFLDTLGPHIAYSLAPGNMKHCWTWPICC